MIKFFRKIRKNLINESKTTRYLKYAVGEILLVMIGILLALQVNNWNEHRKDRRLQKQLLKVLITDLNHKKQENISDLAYGRKMVELSQPIIDTWKNETQISNANLKYVLNRLSEDYWFFNEMSPTYISISKSELWNQLPDSLTRQINNIYNLRFGLIKMAFERSTDYAKACKLNYLVPNDLLDTDQELEFLKANINKQPAEFIAYLKLFRNGLFRLTDLIEGSISDIEKLTKNLEHYKSHQFKS